MTKPGGMRTDRTFDQLREDLEHEIKLWARTAPIQGYILAPRRQAILKGGSVTVTLRRGEQDIPLTCERFNGETRGPEFNLCSIKEVVRAYRLMDQRGIGALMADGAKLLALQDPNDPYYILGTSSKASKEQLMRAYRTAKGEAHPDKHNGSQDPWDRVEWAAKQLDLN